MKQYGDITKLDGAKLEPVDLIVGGSPCQDLSIAGQRKGLEGERSGLFMEMIRVIKEMRNATNFIRPRYALWENVPGAFSSNEGKDFQSVLTELCRIAEPGTPDVPMPEEGWTKAGVLLGPDWSIVWRTHDAQYWGVPQRRRRIALVADFRGQSAAEILFERKGVSGDIEPSGEEREDPAEGIGRSTEKADGNQVNAVFDSQVYHGCKEFLDGISQTVNAQYGTGGNNQPLVVAVGNGQSGNTQLHEMVPTLSTIHDQQAVMVSAVDCRNLNEHQEVSGTLQCKQNGGYSLNYQNPIWVQGEVARTLKAKANCDFREDSETYPVQNNAVRRLTPLECERLQGYPDGWTGIPGASDSARYRALGNSIALPFWEHLARRFVRIGGVKTNGSLFDGIGGFPLVFKRAGAETKWTSEIEPFCEDVVRYHYERGEL